MRISLIRQHDEKDCGAACLKMILQAYGKKIPMAAIRDAIKVDQDGTNIDGLIKGARQFSLKGESFKGSATKVWTAINDEPDEMPAIIRIFNRAGEEHFAVVVGIRKGKLMLLDPDAGRIEVTLKDFEEIYCGGIITFKKSRGFTKENACKEQLTRFTNLILSQKKLLIVIGFLSLIATGISMTGAYIFQLVIDHGLNNMNTPDQYQALRDLFVILKGLAVLYVFRAAIQIFRGKLLTILSSNIDQPLILGYYNQITDLPIDFFSNYKTGEIMSRLNDAGSIRDALSNVTLTIMMDVVMVISCAVLLYKQSHVLFLLASVIFVLYVLISASFVIPIDNLSRDVMEKSSVFTSHLKESFDGMIELKAAQAEEVSKEKTEALFKGTLKSSIRVTMLSVGKDTLIEAITSIGTLILIGEGVIQVTRGNMTIGSLVAFNSLLAYYLDPITNLINLQNSIQSAFVAADRLNDILDIKTENKEGKIPDREIHDISVKHVDFRYGNRDLVLSDLNFSFHYGEKIALVGESGSGKSTVTKLLMGMYTPENGDISVNGVSMQDISLKWLRKHMAYVQQNTTMFSGSVRDNLLLGIPSTEIPSDEEICKILKACCCEFIIDHPFGIDFVLEENGSNISGGQKQRLAIVRAILRKPHVLIMDEATSALDTITEYRILTVIHELLPHTAVIMVAHRLNTIINCDQILVLDENGHVAERGTHHNLLKLNRRYANLWNQQDYKVTGIA